MKSGHQKERSKGDWQGLGKMGGVFSLPSDSPPTKSYPTAQRPSESPGDELESSQKEQANLIKLINLKEQAKINTCSMFD